MDKNSFVYKNTPYSRLPHTCIPTENRYTGVPSETNANLVSYHKVLSKSPFYPVFTLWYEVL